MAKKQPQQFTSPAKYIAAKGRGLPLYKCLVNENWQSGGLANIVVMRKHTNGRITAAIYLVDLLALGVKDTAYIFNEPEYAFMERLEAGQEMAEQLVEISYVEAHNIIYGAVAFAEEHGFKPHKDFALTARLLEEDTEDIELIEYEFGVDGKPLIVAAPRNHGGDWDDDYWGDDDDVPDYEAWTDEQWKAALTNMILDEESHEDYNMTDAFLEKWARDKYAGQTMPLQALAPDEIEMTDDRLCIHDNQTEEEMALLRQLLIEFREMTLNDHLPELKIKVENAIEQYPENPMFLNYLAAHAQLSFDHQKYTEILDETLRKFPDYIFGKIGKAHEYLNDGNAGAVHTLFGGCFSLRELYPSRKVFHVTEVVNFYGVIVRYALQVDAPVTALRYLDEMTDIKWQYDFAWKNSYEIADTALTKYKKEKILDYLDD